MSNDFKDAINEHENKISQYENLENEQDKEFYVRKLVEIVDGEDAETPDISNEQQVRSLELSAVGYGANLSKIAEEAKEKDRYYD